MNLPDIELVSARVHEAWMESKKAKGVTSRKSESGEELMVPYEQLTEASKDLDRSSVQAVYKAIKELQIENRVVERVTNTKGSNFSEFDKLRDEAFLG